MSTFDSLFERILRIFELKKIDRQTDKLNNESIYERLFVKIIQQRFQGWCVIQVNPSMTNFSLMIGTTLPQKIINLSTAFEQSVLRI